VFDTVFNESLRAPRGGLSRDEVFSLFNLQPPEQTSPEAVDAA